MTEFHQLSETQKKDATSFSTIIDALDRAERAAFDSIKDDYDQAKAWLDKHPKVKKAGLVFGGLTGLYLVKRYNMGSPKVRR